MSTDPDAVLSFECPKCGHERCEVGQLRGTGGLLSSIFDVQRERFTSVSCARCRYTELYKADRKRLEEILDFVTH